MTFADLGLSPETLRAIQEVGYEHPTPIQEKAIPHVLMGRDVLGIAQTGTGKTAGFTLPMIEILANGRAKARMPRSLILAPTRELATQVSENFTTYGKYHKLDMALLIGGESMGDQMKALDKGVDVLIATPGRLLDLFERGKVLLRDVKVLVIDEADRMLDMGFIPDVERIVTLLPPLRQTLFFSATMDKEIRKLADAFLSNPREVSIERRATAAETVTQFMAMVPRIDKREALRHILRTENVKNAFIFCNRKRDVDVLNRSLKKHGFNCISLHGDMDQPTRNEMLRRFKDGEADLLVCSDVAARGLDIDDVSHVINFDIPTHSEDYVHRIGRTGRAGKEGAAFSLATPDDAKYVAGIESLLGRSIPRMPLEGLESIMTEDGEAERSNRRRREPRGDDRAAGRSDGRAASRSDDRRSRPKATDDRATRSRRGGRGRSGEDRDGVRAMSHADDVVAFGDHTPAFFMVSTLVPMGSPVSGGGDEDEETTTGERTRNGRRAKPRTRDARKAAPASRRGERKRHGRRDSRPDGDGNGDGEAASTDDAAVPEDTAPEETPQPVEASGGDDAETEAPPPRKRRATRRRKAEPEDGASTSAETATEAEAEAGADTGAGPAKPKRTRRRKTAEPTADADADAPGAADSESGEAPKPKRTRRRTKATAKDAASEETGAADGADGPENAEPKPKPRRTRSRKKADAPKDDAAPPTEPGPEPDPAAEA
jgi:superfamily II DNA/RNA helicase